MPLPILALAVASFCIGTTEFVIMGLLPEVAADLGVSIPAAGLLVTGYALGVVIGAPIIAVGTARLPRKPVLIGLAMMFVLGNLLCAIAPTYWTLMIARVITAFGHGAFFGIGSVVAASLVPANKRATFFAVVVIGLLSVAAIAWLVPAGVAPPGKGGVAGEVKVLGKLQVWLAMMISALASGSLFAIFTYIKPILTDVSGVSVNSVTWILLLFGGGMTIGNIIGGKLADWKLMPTAIGALVVMAAIHVAFAEFSYSAPAAILLIFLWGVITFVIVPPMQMRVVETASEAPNLAATLNQGAFNAGNAAGAWAGGAAISMGVNYADLPFVGAAIALSAFGVALISFTLDRRDAIQQAA